MIEKIEKLDKVLVTMKYEFEGVPKVSKITSTIQDITNIYIGHIDVKFCGQRTFEDGATLRSRVIVNSRLAHIARFLAIV